MLTLGINAYGHDPAVALVESGEVRFFLEEERCVRVKHAPGRFPSRALHEAFAHARAAPADVAAVGYPFDARRYLVSRAIRHGLLRGRLHAARRTAALSLRRFGLDRDLRLATGSARLPPARFLDHHRCHAASAFLTSAFDEAATLTVDGVGEEATIAFHRCAGAAIETVATIDYPHSLGAFYSSIALHLGFGGGSPEGKLMGLAAWGEPRFLPLMRRIVATPSDGQLAIDLSYFDYPRLRRGVSRRFAREVGRARERDAPITDLHRDLAASAQARLEEVLVGLARHAMALAGSRNLCLAGGVALNTVANSRILEESGCVDIHIVPAAHDAGAAMGAALLLSAEERGFVRHPLSRAALGSTSDVDDVAALVSRAALPASRVEDLPAAIADDLAASRIIALRNGRDEAGPRALGNRSILADPRPAAMRDRLNLEVKKRESFRPFAPVVREEDVPIYFDGPRRSPYMLLTARATPLARATIPAALHVDGTARLQTVSRHEAPLLWRTLSELGNRTGVPVAINTSFNGPEEPLVHTAAEAYRCFRAHPIDVLYLGPYRVARTAHLPALADEEAASEPSDRFSPLEQ